MVSRGFRPWVPGPLVPAGRHCHDRCHGAVMTTERRCTGRCAPLLTHDSRKLPAGRHDRFRRRGSRPHQRPAQDIRTDPGRQRGRPGDRAGRGGGVPRAERRREVHHHRHAAGSDHSPDAGIGQGLRCPTGRRRAGGPGRRDAAGRRAAAGRHRPANWSACSPRCTAGRCRCSGRWNSPASPTSPARRPPSCPAANRSAFVTRLALVPDPDLLVLDEPTVAMDVEVRRAFWASMRDVHRSGRTVLFATHYLDEADAFADRVVVLADGVIVADGTGAQIKSSVGRPDDLGGDPRCGCRTVSANFPASSASITRRPESCCTATTPMPRCGRCWPATRTRTTSRSPPATSRTPSCELTAYRSPGVEPMTTTTTPGCRRHRRHDRPLRADLHPPAYRNIRFLVLTVALPLLLFLLYANIYQGADAGSGLSVVAYLMVSMASFGCIGAAINTGARVAIERQTGLEPATAADRAARPFVPDRQGRGVHAGHAARADPGVHRRRHGRQRLLAGGPVARPPDSPSGSG